MSEATLRRSVITSSSARELVDLFREVRAICGDDVEFDLITLREPDIVGIESEFGVLKPQATEVPGDPLFPRTFTEIMADDENLPAITQWILKQLTIGRARVAALATYFPNISSAYKHRRQCAIDALVNTARLAITLVEWGLADHAVVELVCGTILDPCECAECQKTGRTFASTPDAKFEVLLSSLKSVVAKIRDLQSSGKLAKKPFALAVELEPGHIYLLNGRKTLELFFRKLDACCEKDEQSQTPLNLRSCIGLNLDIAHMRIAGVEKEDLQPYVDRIVHAHIADHPGMHTRDQITGSWTTLDRYDNGYQPYLEILFDRLNRANGQGLPYTHSVALELEGCNRIGWIYDSLYAMKHLLEMCKP